MRIREVVCAAGVALLIPVSGFACTVSHCVEDFKLSAGGLTIPANAPVVPINTFGAYWESFEVVLEKGDGEPVELSGQGWQIEPTDGFEENESYTVRIGIKENTYFDTIHICGDSTPEFEFATGIVEPYPTQLGSLTSSEVSWEPLKIDTSDSCTGTLSVAYVDVELDLPTETKVWQGGLMIETYVNNVLWRGSSSYGEIYTPGESWVGYGKDRIFVICEDQYSHIKDVAEGMVDIQFRAHIPGTDVFLESETIAIELRCKSEPEPEPKPDNGSDSGCSTSQGMGGWFAFGMVFLLARKRRRINPAGNRELG